MCVDYERERERKREGLTFPILTYIYIIFISTDTTNVYGSDDIKCTKNVPARSDAVMRGAIICTNNFEVCTFMHSNIYD